MSNNSLCIIKQKEEEEEKTSFYLFFFFFFKSFDKKPKAIELPIETDDKKQPEQEPQLVLQRSETFTVNKLPQEEADASPSPTKPMTTNSQTFKSTNVQRCSTTRTMASTNTSVVRPSRLPSRCPTNRNANSTPSKPLSSNTNSKIDTRSSSAKKVSKLPIRTMNQPTKQITPVKKSNVTTSVASKTKKDATIPTSTRAVTSMNSSSTKRIIRPPTITKPSVTQTSSSTSKFRSRSITTVNNKTNTNSSIPMPINKRTRTTPPAVKKVTNEPSVPTKKSTKPNDESTNCSMEKMNSTSSESSIEEKRQTNKILAIVQDEGYSTWSSSDVKDETNSKKALPEERRRNTGLVKNWLDTSNQRCSTKPVNEGRRLISFFCIHFLLFLQWNSTNSKSSLENYPMVCQFIVHLYVHVVQMESSFLLHQQQYQHHMYDSYGQQNIYANYANHLSTYNPNVYPPADGYEL